MGKPKLPHTVKRGSASVKIYLTPTKGFESYTISYWISGKRKRKTFADFKAAKSEAEKIANQLTTGDLDVLTLKSADRAAYLRATQQLDPLGVPLETAATQYAEAKKQLGDVPLAQAVEFYLKRHPRNIAPRTVEAVIKELIAAKQADGMSDVYLQNLRYNLGKFQDAFHCNIGDVTGTDMDRWLRDLGLSARTRNNIRAALKTLFNFARNRKYVPKDHDELDAVGIAKKDSGDIGIFQPAEMVLILSHAQPEMVPFLALGGFAGIRHAEIQRLDWKDIRFEDAIIEIRAGKAKTASRRTIPLLENLQQWLSPYYKTSGPVYSGRKPGNMILSLIDEIHRKADGDALAENFEWKHNGMRHSFISYRVAETQNVAQVALEAGNSPQMVFRHYRELVTPKAAKAWFEVQPREHLQFVALPRNANAA